MSEQVEQATAAPGERRNLPAGAAYLTTEQLAARLQVPMQTVRKWRTEGVGPEGHKFGRHVRYRLDLVKEWEADHA